MIDMTEGTHNPLPRQAQLGRAVDRETFQALRARYERRPDGDGADRP